jgi:hypothetical protein
VTINPISFEGADRLLQFEVESGVCPEHASASASKASHPPPTSKKPAPGQKPAAFVGHRDARRTGDAAKVAVVMRPKWPLGGTADAGDLKSLDSNIVPVRVREGPPEPKAAESVPVAQSESGAEIRPSGQAIGQDHGQQATPRAALMAALTSAVRDAASAGDLAAARVAHEALGRLLSEPGVPGPVIDLNAERERRR